jgi:peptidoglycan/LPS O-acetylase OafA/YrhL
VEEQFYLIFPFIIILLPKDLIAKIFFGAIVTALVWRIISVNSPALVNDPNRWSSRFPLSAFDALFGGALLAYFKVHHYVRIYKFFSYKAIPFLLFFLIALTTLLTVQQDAYWTDLFLRLNCTLIGIITIGYAVTIGYKGFARWFLEQPAVIFMGKISYGIYLFHPFIQELYFQYFPIKKLEQLCTLVPKLQYNIYIPHFIILFIFTIVISVISFFLFEKRFLKLKRYFI